MLTRMQILYEDNHLIAVQKEHGELTQSDDSGADSLMDRVKIFIKERDNKPGNVFLGLLHRLDRPVGGVVLFAKTSKGASRISEQFRNRSIEKVYWCVVELHPDTKLQNKGTVIQWLKKDHENNLVSAFNKELPGSMKAELSYKVLNETNSSKFGNIALVEVRPKTGRPHQIRVAFSSLNTPIAGDKKYGAHTTLNRDIALFARTLTFRQPVTKELVQVSSEPNLPIFREFR